MLDDDKYLLSEEFDDDNYSILNESDDVRNEIEYYNKKDICDVYQIYICYDCDFAMLSKKNFCPACNSRKINKKLEYFDEF